MNLVVAAQSIARSTGWPVFPMTKRKVPPAGCGLSHASADPEQVRLLFGTRGAELVAIATGEASGVSAIDIDPDAAQWLESRRNLFPPTWAQRTPRGGWHLLYEHPPGLRCSAGKIAKGVDIRADGGSCIIWGDGYEIVDGRDPTPFPGWILAAIARADQRRDQRRMPWQHEDNGEGNIDALVNFVRKSRTGERNARLFWAACRDAGRHPHRLLDAARELGFDRFSFTEMGARATIESAMRMTRR